MRCIGNISSEPLACAFSDRLTLSHIEHRIVADDAGLWEVWIYNEDDLEQARESLASFKASPVPVVPDLSQQAEALRRRAIAEYEKTSSIPIDIRTRWRSPSMRMPPVTFILLALSIAVSVYTRLGEDVDKVMPLFITSYDTHGLHFVYNVSLPELRNGQFWRLLTPVFLHFGFMHLFFNMMWLKDLGSAIEVVKGSWFYLFLFLVTAIPSNVGQFFMSGPSFGGMSGVVYGYLGYVWMKEKFDPASRLMLQPGTVTMMLIWFVLCLTGILGPVANTAHGVGLVVGVLVGLVDAKRARWR